MSASSLQRGGARLTKTKTPGIYAKGNRYVVTFRDPSGKQRKRFAKTLAEARTLKAALTADVKRSEYVEESRVSFVDYAGRWIETYDGRTARVIRPGTLRDYRRALGFDERGEPTGSGAIEHFGRMPLASIRPQDVKAYAAKLADRGIARNTVRLAVAPVKALLATAHEEGLLRSNPAAGLRLGRVVAKAPVKQTHALTEEEVVRVLAEVPETYRLLAEFLAQSGLRISEALALTKADVDFGRRRLSVSRRLYEGVLDAPKSRHGVRRVPLSPGLSQRLWKLLATAEDEALVFSDANGKPLDRTSLYRVVRLAGERAGIEWPVGLHTFRHSCASIMFRRGVPKEAIRRLLGHHSWDFTAGTYVHLDDDDLPDGGIVGDLVATSVAAPGHISSIPAARWCRAMEQPRKWRLLVALDFPKREPEMVDEHGNPGLPPKLEFTSRVAPQVTTIDGVRVGIRAWSRDPLPIEITGPLHLDREIVELVLVVAAETSEEALTAAAPIVEDVVESLSFEMHYASRPIMTSVLDVTEPVAIGETRDFAQRAGFPLPAFMQSAALGHVAIADEARLPSEMSNLQRHVAAARGWYVKSLSTPYTADQFIFLWIALEILWGKSDHKTSGSFACRHGHMIAYCPTCAAPTERPVFGLGIRTFLVEESGLSEDEASQLWKARQIMHGSIPFDSAEMRDLPTRVQVLRAAVAHALKAQLGRDPGALPQVVAGGLAIDPTGTGVSGTRTIGPEDLGWPATA